MPATRVQNVSNDAAAASVTLTVAAPTAGNLLLLGVFAAAGDQTTMTPPSGWSQASATTSATTGVTAVYWKIATGTEGTSLVVSGTTAATFVTANFTEWSSGGPAWATNPVDATGSSSPASGTTATVAATAATTQAQTLGYAVIGLGGTSGGWLNTWTGGYVQNHTSTRLSSATKQTTATETPSTTETWTTARVPRAALATFKIPSNTPPTANAGADQTNVEPWSTVTLTGTASDPDGTIASVQWAQTAGTPTVTLTGATTNTATFEAPGTLAGTTLTFSYTVTDNSGATAVDTMTVAVLQASELIMLDGVWVPARMTIL